MKKKLYCIIITERTGWDAGDHDLYDVYICDKNYTVEQFKLDYPEIVKNENLDIFFSVLCDLPKMKIK